MAGHSMLTIQRHNVRLQNSQAYSLRQTYFLKWKGIWFVSLLRNEHWQMDAKPSDELETSTPTMQRGCIATMRPKKHNKEKKICACVFLEGMGRGGLSNIHSLMEYETLTSYSSPTRDYRELENSRKSVRHMLFHMWVRNLLDAKYKESMMPLGVFTQLNELYLPDSGRSSAIHLLDFQFFEPWDDWGKN